MKRKLVILWLVLAVSVCAMILAEKSSPAYNKNNPRWEAPEHIIPPQPYTKPYKPLRQPPGAIPPRQHRTGNSKALDARVSLGDFIGLGVAGGVFVGIVLVAARPLAVGLSTVRSRFDWRERMGLSVMGPRGLLPAGLSTVCALRLIENGHREAWVLAPLTLLVVAGTVIACTAAAPFVARWEHGAAEPSAPGTPRASVNAGMGDALLDAR